MSIQCPALFSNKAGLYHFPKSDDQMNATNWYKHRLILAVGFFMVGLVLPWAVLAEVTFIWWGAPAEVRIRVGVETDTTTVVHSVPLALNGNGTPISGVPADVVIEVSARRETARDMNQVYFIVTADSSTPLSSGLDTIPFTEISWVSQDGDIPAGRFDGTTSQVILDLTRARWRISDRLTFIYDNDQAFPGGTYKGRVTYTISIP
ncbi:MAG: hypothetical protein ABFS43_01665 [Thermodesulfobacteriota bacterium]